jgi:hypothetical protein
MAHGSEAEVERAKKILGAANPMRMDVVGGKVAELA